MFSHAEQKRNILHIKLPNHAPFFMPIACHWFMSEGQTYIDISGKIQENKAAFLEKIMKLQAPTLKEVALHAKFHNFSSLDASKMAGSTMIRR